MQSAATHESRSSVRTQKPVVLQPVACMGIHKRCPLAAGDLIVEIANRTPVKDSFQFGSIAEGLHVRGTYVLQYEVQPSLPGLPALTHCTTVLVAAGQPISLELQVHTLGGWLRPKGSSG